MKKLLLVLSTFLALNAYAQHNPKTLVSEDELPTMVERILEQRDSVANGGYKIRKIKSHINLYLDYLALPRAVDQLERYTCDDKRKQNECDIYQNSNLDTNHFKRQLAEADNVPKRNKFKNYARDDSFGN